MQLLMNPVDESKQLNQAQFPLKLDYHSPKGVYKITHQGLMIPGLPAPLHYFNFLAIVGQPNIPMLRNPYAIKTYPLDTVSMISSVSPHMVGHFHGYSIQDDCEFSHGSYAFAAREYLTGGFPKFRLTRVDSELSVDLDIETYPVISYFGKSTLGLFEHWSLLCHCKGEIIYKQERYSIDHLGSFEYARALNIPYLPWCFLSYQIINLSQQRQMLFMQIRNSFNQITQSRIYLRDLNTAKSEMFEGAVVFKVHRVYPKVKTPNGQEMYLPREFEWNFRSASTTIKLQAQSRGDYKFGLAAGYVGSFCYQIKINDHYEEGKSGYCEYIDCRSLKWQEQNQNEKTKREVANPVPYSVKK